MTDLLLTYVPTYGVWLILVCVFLSSLAIPIPSSIMIMAAGGFAAVGDINLYQLVAFSVLGYWVGDQCAYLIGRRGGEEFLDKDRSDKITKIIGSAQSLIDRFGGFAVVLSHTIMSPLAPYVTYMSGALRLNWALFTISATISAAIWVVAYVSLGYFFANQISEIAGLIGTSIGIIILIAVAVLIIVMIYRNWRKEMAMERLRLQSLEINA